MAEQLLLEVIVGSVRPERFGPVAANWFLHRARAIQDFEVGVLDLAEFELPVDLSETPAAERFRARVAQADAFVAVTPEYNHGYPASLKLALDSAKREWRGKPVGFVSYGGPAGGLRAVEQLRQVVAELHMVSVRDAVSFHQIRKNFDPADRYAADSADRLLRELAWWAKALRPARPYPG
ncbi:MAG: NAD(P)H-dependent oxidoreductase [Mycobacteriaceae bacterium]|nr:NAD(P)H-dependent oxidoreductase [Mycobacteriaceae bacterium]